MVLRARWPCPCQHRRRRRMALPSSTTWRGEEEATPPQLRRGTGGGPGRAAVQAPAASRQRRDAAQYGTGGGAGTTPVPALCPLPGEQLALTVHAGDLRPPPRLLARPASHRSSVLRNTRCMASCCFIIPWVPAVRCSEMKCLLSFLLPPNTRCIHPIPSVCVLLKGRVEERNRKNSVRMDCGNPKMSALLAGC